MGHLGSKYNAWEVSGVCNNHSSGLSGTQLVCVCVGGRGVLRPLPSPGIQLFLLRQEFWPLCTVHMATMGPILRTLENTAPEEKGWILVQHKGPQCHSVDQGTNGGKEQHSCPLRLSSLEVAAPWDHSVQTLSKARTKTQQGAKQGGKIPQHSSTSADLKPLRPDPPHSASGPTCSVSLYWVQRINSL